MGESSGDKSEEPTPHKLREARKKGQVSKSKEITSAVLLLISFVVLKNSAPAIWRQLSIFMTFAFEQISTPFSMQLIGHLLISAMTTFFTAVAPLFIATLIAAIAIEMLQTGGGVYSAEALQPKLSKLNPLEGFKRIFFSMKGFVALVINLIKISIVFWIVYAALRDDIRYIASAMEHSLAEILIFASSTVYKVATRVALFYFVVALFDYLYQRHEFMKQMRMSKQEIKEEYKRLEGDPQVKQRIRQAQREMSQARMMGKVPGADVVVTNPIHLAVAIKYDPSQMKAPTVVAKGQRLWAEEIKRTAEAEYIPIIENVELAQRLYKIVKLDGEIPPDLYRAVAELLAFVYNLKRRRKRKY